MTAAAAAAEAQSRAWSLLAALLRGRPAPQVLEAARRSPLLDDALRGGNEEDGLLALEEALRFEAFPWQGVVLGREGTLAGPSAAALSDLYRRCGFDPASPGEEPDHLAAIAGCLAHLGGALADAEADGEEVHARRVRELLREVHDLHLLRWLPTWTVAMGRTGAALPRALALQVFDLALLQRGELGEPWPEAFAVECEAVDLGDPAVGLRAIGEALSRPSFAGALLTRRDLTSVARTRDLPRGFGDRASLLETLLRQGAMDDGLMEVTEALAALLRAHEAERRRLAADAPWMKGLLDPHGERVEAAVDLLGRIGKGAGGESVR